MKKKSSSRASTTKVKRPIAASTGNFKVKAEHSEADRAHIIRGIVRQGLKEVPSKTSISLRIDAEVLEWYKAQGPGYQTRINAVLRAFRDASG